MDWSKGYSATYYLSVVDAPSWRDLVRIEIISGSVKKESTGLRESADLVCTEYPRNREQWVRVWMDVRQNGSSAHEPIFTGLACSPDWDVDRSLVKSKVQCYSVLKPADDVLLPRGWYATAGATGARVVEQLLQVTPAPKVMAEGSPVLQSSIVAEDGETNLSMAEKILTAINWRLRISGDGTISIEPKPVDAVAIFDPHDMDVVETSLGFESDWYDVPNVFRAIDDDLTAVARNDDPDSPLSTVARGREVWAEDLSCDLATDESIAEYAARRLKDMQQTEMVVSYDRRYVPGVTVSDLVQLRYPEQGADGVYLIQRQDIALEYGARVSEESAIEETYVQDSFDNGLVQGVNVNRLLVLPDGNYLKFANGDRLMVRVS